MLDPEKIDVSAAMDDVLEALDRHVYTREIIHPIAFILMIGACASWWWNKPQIAAFVSAVVAVLSVYLIVLIVRIRGLTSELAYLAGYLDLNQDKQNVKKIK
tara:strand:- start:239 stop:544 length:306 start_codon:yes stop_codon:yes gene_type:complete